MGNSSRAVVDAAKRRKKKKGRPSLLDLQKRSLRLQNHQQQNNNNNNNNNRSPNPNPYLRFPRSATATPSSSRRPTRRNPNLPQDEPPPPPDAGRDDEDEDEEDGGKRREKKLKLVLRLPSHYPGSASESDADPKRRKTGHGDRDKKAERNNSSKAMDSVPATTGEQSDSGPTTPLPDKKLLEFILDRLQKKDTYGVFSEPVDPEELPDYHEVIEHPMDFGTVRKKLFSGAYANLEQFENDVFLISSNAMRYNAPDTIYHRQARSIQELAKKNFENLRQESDDNEPEPKTVVRRGRPPNKNKKVGRPPADRAALDFSSDAALANAGDITHWSNLAHDTSRKGPSGDKPGIADISNRASYGLRSTGTFGWISEQKVDRNEEYSGSSLKGIPTKYGKKPIVVDENRRNTYKQSLMSTYTHESPIFTTFDGEKQLIPVGLHLENAYARSLARFAAKLGPVGWVLASKMIQRVLPPGTKFGPGWVGDSEAPQHSQPPLLSTSPPHPSAKPINSPCTTSDKHPLGQEMPQNDSVVNESHFRRTAPPADNQWTINSGSPLPVPGNNSKGPRQSMRLQPKSDSVPPDLNVGFHSPGSPASGVVVDSQQPDLALQL